MPEPILTNVISFNTTISGFEKGGQRQEAVPEPILTNVISFSAAISAEICAGPCTGATADNMASPTNVISFNAVFSAFASGRGIRCEGDALGFATVLSLSAAITACAKGRPWQAAVFFSAGSQELALDFVLQSSVGVGREFAYRSAFYKYLDGKLFSLEHGRDPVMP